MTRHLSPQEFVDAAEDLLPATRVTHLDRCAACRQELESLRQVMTDLGPAGTVPEPSPLFWDHFAGRVRATTDAEPAAAPSGWRERWQPLAALAAVMAVAALLFVFRPSVIDLPAVDRTVVDAHPPPVQPPASVPAPAPPSNRAAVDTPEDASPEAARSWERLVDAGKAASVDQVHGIVPAGPGTMVLIEDLSPRELQEFARLLRAQPGGVQ